MSALPSAAARRNLSTAEEPLSLNDLCHETGCDCPDCRDLPAEEQDLSPVAFAMEGRMNPRIVLEDLLVALARYRRVLSVAPPSVEAAHREEAEFRATLLHRAGAPTPAQRKSAMSVARDRLRGDRRARRCLCHLGHAPEIKDPLKPEM